MDGPIDFTLGGYDGDVVEEAFAPFTKPTMPFWWQFREVLRANHMVSPHLKKTDGTDSTDDEQRQFVALSLLNYRVHKPL